MTENHDLARAGISFFGEVTAGVTHEIRNSLAILKEISGLLSDLALACSEGEGVASDRVKDLASRMNSQVDRANATVGLLHRFAHSVDSPRRCVDLSATVRMLTDLAMRQAHRNRVGLRVEIPEGDLQVESDPFLLEHVIYRLLGKTIESTAVEGTVTVTLMSVPDGAQVRFAGAAYGMVKLRGAASQFLSLLGSSAEYEGRIGTLVLSIPGTMPGGEDEQDG